MKAIVFLFLLISLAAQTSVAQDDDSITFVHGLPITGEDSAQDVPAYDFAPTDSLVRITAEHIPGALRKTLSEEPLFKGWQRDTIILDKNTGLYWLHRKAGTGIRSYGFNSSGKQVSFRERTLKE
jgi:hypothetical protein